MVTYLVGPAAWLGESINRRLDARPAQPCLICPVRNPYTYSSIFVSGEIAFVLLCLLINPSIGLSLGTRLPRCPVWKSSWGV